VVAAAEVVVEWGEEPREVLMEEGGRKPALFPPRGMVEEEEAEEGEPAAVW
jgi:hypothetical protein